MNGQMYKIRVNGRNFEHEAPEISGRELLKLIGVHLSADYEILLLIKPEEFEPVEMNEKVDLQKSPETIFTVKPYPEAKMEVDDEFYPFTEVFMTPVEIMTIAGLKEGEFYLKQLIGHQEITYKNDKNHVIALHDCIKFVSCKTANTTVS
jgi:hypothetical protein